jgi:hypothetical protein
VEGIVAGRGLEFLNWLGEMGETLNREGSATLIRCGVHGQLWVDAMWIDAAGKLWLPAAQLSRGIPFNNGMNRIVKRLHVFTVDIGIGPSPIDHA